MRWLFLIALIASPAAAAERNIFYGSWGSERQYSRELIKPGATRITQPFEIGPEWLRHGQIWCRLNWFPIEPKADGFFTGARAHCGEDSVQAYFLRMHLSKEGLTLRWNFALSNGPLQRCPAS